MRTLDEALTHWMRTNPDALFLREAHTGHSLTYGACWSRVQRLRAHFGAHPQVILMAIPSGIAASLLWLTALTSGHRVLPCPPDMPAEELARRATAQRADVIVVAKDNKQTIAKATADTRVLTMQELLRLADDESFAPDSLPTRSGSVRLTTSGTTGEPKGVILSAEQIAWTAEHIARSHGLTPQDRGFTVLPFFHINAPVVSLCGTLISGGSLVIAPRFSRTHFWETLARERITWASIVPTVLALLLAAPERAPELPFLRFVRTASAPLPVAHLRAFEQRFSIPVVETYGLSEAASQITANPIPPAQHRPGSVGLPTGVELRICLPRTGSLAEPLCDVGRGMTGEVCVRGPSLISAYEGGAGASSYWDGWFRTGDLGYQDSDGYLYLTGRLREVINRGGEKIAPREIEERLLEHHAVGEVAVVGEPDPIYGQRVAAYIVPRATTADDGTASPPLDDATSETLRTSLRTHCEERFAAYKVPAVFYFVDALPRNRTGKIARNQLTPQFFSQAALMAAATRAS